MYLSSPDSGAGQDVRGCLAQAQPSGLLFEQLMTLGQSQEKRERNLMDLCNNQIGLGK